MDPDLSSVASNERKTFSFPTVEKVDVEIQSCDILSNGVLEERGREASFQRSHSTNCLPYYVLVTVQLGSSEILYITERTLTHLALEATPILVMHKDLEAREKRLSMTQVQVL